MPPKEQVVEVKGQEPDTISEPEGQEPGADRKEGEEKGKGKVFPESYVKELREESAARRRELREVQAEMERLKGSMDERAQQQKALNDLLSTLPEDEPDDPVERLERKYQKEIDALKAEIAQTSQRVASSETERQVERAIATAGKDLLPESRSILESQLLAGAVVLQQQGKSVDLGQLAGNLAEELKKHEAALEARVAERAKKAAEEARNAPERKVVMPAPEEIKTPQDERKAMLAILEGMG